MKNGEFRMENLELLRDEKSAEIHAESPLIILHSSF